MIISDETIEKIKELKTRQSNVDVHINDDDPESTRRSKDMEFGKMLGIDEVCKLLGIQGEE